MKKQLFEAQTPGTSLRVKYKGKHLFSVNASENGGGGGGHGADTLSNTQQKLFEILVRLPLAQITEENVTAKISELVQDPENYSLEFEDCPRCTMNILQVLDANEKALCAKTFWSADEMQLEILDEPLQKIEEEVDATLNLELLEECFNRLQKHRDEHKIKPTMKENQALAQELLPWAKPGDQLRFERHHSPYESSKNHSTANRGFYDSYFANAWFNTMCDIIAFNAKEQHALWHESRATRDDFENTSFRTVPEERMDELVATLQPLAPYTKENPELEYSRYIHIITMINGLSLSEKEKIAKEFFTQDIPKPRHRQLPIGKA